MLVDKEILSNRGPISRHSRLDLTSQAQPSPAQCHPGLTATGLMLSGAVANGEYKAWEKRSKQAWRGGDSGERAVALDFRLPLGSGTIPGPPRSHRKEVTLMEVPIAVGRRAEAAVEGIDKKLFHIGFHLGKHSEFARSFSDERAVHG